MKKNRKTIHIVQVGTWAMTHADHTMMAMRSMPQIYEVIGVCEPDEARRVSAMNRPAYSNLKWLTIDEIDAVEPDAIMIETHELDQAKLAMIFAEKGYSIHMDKPGGTDTDVFKKLVSIMEKNKTILQLGYMYRYNPAIMHAYELVQSGRIGNIICMEAQMSQRYDRATLDWLGELPGGMFCYLGCHLVDLLYSFMGNPLSVVPMHRSSGTEGTAAADFGMVLYEYPHGVSMLKSVACEVDSFDRRYILLSGTKGTIEIKPLENLTTVPPLTAALYTTCKCVSYHNTHPGTQYTEENRYGPYGRYDSMLVDFARCVRREIINPYPLEHEAAVHDLFIKSCGNHKINFV